MWYCDTFYEYIRKLKKNSQTALQLLRLIIYKILLYRATGCPKSVLAGKYLIKVSIINSSGDRGTATGISPFTRYQVAKWGSDPIWIKFWVLNHFDPIFESLWSNFFPLNFANQFGENHEKPKISGSFYTVRTVSNELDSHIDYYSVVICY